MKILIDYQGAQNSSRERGVGRITRLLSYQLTKQFPKYKFNFLLNLNFSNNLDLVKQELYNFSKNKVFTFKPSSELPIYEMDYKLRNKIHEEFNEIVTKLEVNFLILTSYLDCLHENTVNSNILSDKVKTLLIVYDLIPLKNKKKYLPDSNNFKIYKDKIKTIKSFDKLICFSNFVKKDLQKILQIKSKRITVINPGVDKIFKKIILSKELKQKFLSKYNITKPYLLYMGPTDFRKNIINLIKAFSIFKKSTNNNYVLVICGRLGYEYKYYLEEVKKNLIGDSIIFTNFITDEDVVKLINFTEMFIFPSLEEGFGLPVLEAMYCGVNVVTSNNSSMSEILKNKQALFDPKNPIDIAKKIILNLNKKAGNLKKNKKQILKYNWKNSCQKIKKILENA